VVFEATGAAESISQGLDLLRDYGMMVAIGIHHEPAPIDTTPFVRRKLQLRGAHSSGRENWDRVMALMPSAVADLAPLVTHQIALTEIAEGFEMCRRREACKVIIRPDHG
jgi:threonine dehydrogenase-like Zn-dependent dehydrogenase